jgi:hypothetical protein
VQIKKKTKKNKNAPHHSVRIETGFLVSMSDKNLYCAALHRTLPQTRMAERRSFGLPINSIMQFRHKKGFSSQVIFL